ncbi:hypothetical protein SLEP1_g29017 [Rubroshorea leprosula]|uniref:RNA cytosine-C(5)-methyltransferase NSUN2-like pre-PUA domain-containing protein n=1 Tax=Rubroshorea leprosula TaxID=152421 RepID=A0AAV5JY36_9ROSI|nr:hypothetical protein SLEP1_g29017 [Rubroshorea leprosula]
MFAAATQDKSVSVRENKSTGNDELVEKLSNHAIEDTRVDSVGGTDERISEAGSEADLVGELDGVAFESSHAEAEQGPSDNKAESAKSVGNRKLQIQGKWRGVDPVIFFKDETIINSIKTFYGIDEAFPFSGHLVSRNNDTNHVKRIYYISKSVKDVLELNFQVGQQLKITSIGLKMFVSISAVLIYF